jgi:hypothetical protein
MHIRKIFFISSSDNLPVSLPADGFLDAFFESDIFYSSSQIGQNPLDLA